MAHAKDPEYPQWICHVCGEAYGAWYKRGTYIGPPYHCSTYHNGTCDLCGDTDVPVTEPRDYGHLRAKWKGEIMKSRENN
jgi:hypothetical protein